MGLSFYSGQAIAEKMHKTGVKPSFSTGSDGALTAGYGRLDEFGYFQYPLTPARDYLDNNRTKE